MSKDRPKSLWRIPLARDIGIILIIKLIILFSIKAIWFSEPGVPVDNQAGVAAHLFDTPPVSQLTEEKPR
ncbi:cytochrome oxidase putative small subunit CydP [Pseudomonas sp. Pseusp122]|uniref:cytochrome oxidase putative small subunit CydP n=1 Tax=unclassified Pseudomonas TaxID=196821 RepID=UPI0039A5D41D